MQVEKVFGEGKLTTWKAFEEKKEEAWENKEWGKGRRMEKGDDETEKRKRTKMDESILFGKWNIMFQKMKLVSIEQIFETF